MWPVRELYSTGLVVLSLGAVGGLAAHWWARTLRGISAALCVTALAGSMLEGAAALGSLVFGVDLAWSLPSGIPDLNYAVRLDALGSFFLLTLSLLGVAVSLYSIGYWKHGHAGRSGFSGSLLNLLLLGLALVFTAGSVLFFLFA